jgi:hypothetical protein
MDYMRGWRALRQDPNWMSKVGIACVLLLSAMCIPIVGQVALMGWNTLMFRRAVSGQDSPLPDLTFDFDYLGKLLGVGFKAFLARLLWSLPLVGVFMVMFCCFYVGIGVFAVGAGAAAQSGGGEPGAGMGLGMMCMMIAFIIVYPVVMIVGSFPVQIAMIRAELTDDVGSSVRPKDVLAMTKLLFKELLIGSFVMGLIGMVAGVFGIVTLYIGLFPAIAVVMVIQTYWRAELYRVYLEKGGAPLPVGPLDVPRPQQPPAPQGPNYY